MKGLEQEGENVEEVVEREENPYVAKFLAFFEALYKKDIERIVQSYPQKRSVDIDFKQLEEYDYELADELLDNPDYLIDAADLAVQQIEIAALDIEKFEPHIRFYNIPKDREPLIRDIGSQFLNKLISIEGVVRQITDALPKLTIATWQCKRCGNTYKTPQEGQELQMPTFCECRHRDFLLVQEQSDFIDYQKVQIQEPLERLEGNEQASYLDVYLSDDLVHLVNAGDKVRFVGVMRLYPTQGKKIVFGRFLQANHVEETEREFDACEITPEEEEEIKKLASNPKVNEMLTASIAPSIYGHDAVKESIVLQLFGGVKKTLPGNHQIRGNVHILLVGDPGCLVADERIVLGNGAIEKIGNVGEEHLQELNMQVLTGEGAKKRDKATVFHYYKSQPVIELITESGKSVKGTFNHPLRCVSKKDGKVFREWKRLDKFKVGDRVAVVTAIPCTITKNIDTGFTLLPQSKGPKFKGVLPEKVTPELAALLGYLLGDGWVRKYETGFVVSDDEKDILPKLLGLCTKLFGKKPSVVRRRLEGRTMWLNYGAMYSNNIAQNLMFLREKRIPDLVLKSGNKVAASFLKWLFEADGCVFNNGRGRRAISFKAKNIELLRDIQVLLLRFHIHSIIIENMLNIRRGKDIVRFAEKIGFVSKKKKKRMKNLAEDAKKFGRFNSQRSEKIVKIVEHGLEDVFDIEVPESHRFIANGVVSHNTGKSQLLVATNNIAPKSIYTAGRTTSGVGLCVAPDSIILNDNGFKTIEDFVEENFDKSKAVEEIPNAFSNEFSGKSFCLNANLGIEKGKIYKIWKIKAPEKMIGIKTDSDKHIDLTLNTSMIRKKGNKTEWVKAIDIKKGDSIACSKELTKKPEKSDLQWEKILKKSSFKPLYKFVYDFSVEKNHNFIANGIFVHNTASAVKDDFGEGGWTLKAGALVLASGGICMADELDKMAPEDRVALHEAMEQGMVSVAKAGIVTRFKADTSILAAANPKFSRFDPYQPFIEQVNMPASLISRFDLFFMIKDVLDRTKDEQISNHILKTHRAGEIILQGKKKGKEIKDDDVEALEKAITPPIAAELLRKYVSYTRQNIFPVLSKDATKAIGDFYIQLRDMGRKEGSYAATHRQLEGLIRLSEASARIKLRDTVEKEDADRAIRLVRTCLQDLVTDPETGKIDYDIIATGQTHTQMTNMKKVMNIVKAKAQEVDMVPLQDVLDQAKEEGIDGERAREVIEKLEKKGELYRPRHGFLKPTHRG